MEEIPKAQCSKSKANGKNAKAMQNVREYACSYKQVWSAFMQEML